MSNSIGEILNSKRRELGFSQTELASALAIDGIEVTNQAISKWETGRSAGEWVDNARLSLARTLLHDPSIPISEVSYRLGFEDPAYFSRFFRKLVGMSPTDFRSM